MIEAEIHARIADALSGRRDQRRFVDDLAAAWRVAGEVFEQLVRALEGAEKAVRDGPAVPGAPPITETIGALLRDPATDDPATDDPATDDPAAGDGTSRVDRLRDRLDAAARQVEAVCARVRRDTVNVGVIGGTKVGKSTLLRTITDLPDTVIPTTRFNPTTAAASRIYHTDGEPRATLDLHTWESFREEYLAPLHRAAGLGPAPRDPEAFRRYAYPEPGSAAAGHAKADDYLRKLRSAHVSFGSYADLLAGSRRTMTVDFARLRPYVAYPDLDAGDPVAEQPFHAVRGVRIDQRFPRIAATKLGLVDLPGAGEAGIDIDRQFLQGVKNEIDLLLMVKRGTPNTASYLAEDSYPRNLADSARGGVPLTDYYLVLVNRDAANDPTGDYFANTVKSVAETSKERDIRVLTADVVDAEDTFANLVRPALDHLATRLAEMDRAAVREALALAIAVGGEVAAYAGDVLGRTRDWLRKLPDQEDEVRDLAERLRDDLADDLVALVDRYDVHLAAGEADAALTAAIGDSVDQARAWVRDGLGHGSRQAWMTKLRGRYVQGPLRTKQDEYYRAKTEITDIFSRVDVSLESSIRRLWDDVADVLRGRLTEELVPVGPAALDDLRETADSRRALILRDGLARLCRLKVDYGSVVLRVTQPVIREIDWVRSPVFRTAAAMPPPAPQAPPPAPPPRTAPAAVGGWIRQPDGSMKRAPAPPPQAPPPAPQAPQPAAPAARPSVHAPVRGGEQEAAKLGAEGLYDELTAVVDRCVTDLETALRDETRVMARTLAAAADRFFDSVIRTNRNERDFERLCRPNQRSIWPDHFDGGMARVAADLSRVEEQARQVVTATEAVKALSAGLRMRPLAEQ